MKYLFILGALLFAVAGCSGGGEFRAGDAGVPTDAGSDNGGLGHEDGGDNNNGSDNNDGGNNGNVGGNNPGNGNNNGGNNGNVGGNNPGNGNNNGGNNGNVGGNNPGNGNNGGAVGGGNQSGIEVGQPATPPGYPGGIEPTEPGTISTGDTSPGVEYPDLGDPEPPKPGEPGAPPGPGPEPGSDKIKPVIAFVQTPGVITNQSTAHFEIWVNDNVGGRGISHNECSIDNGQFANCDKTFDYQNLVDGGHIVVARTIDFDGNVSEPVAYSWLVDTTKPGIELTKHPNNPSANGNAIFEFVGQDDLSGIGQYQCSIDGGAYQICESGQSYSNLPDGNHSFAVVAVDNAGNVSEAAEFDWLVDSTIPSVEITKHPSNPSNRNDASFEFTAAVGNSGLSGYKCSLDGGVYVACASPKNYSGLSDGNHKFSVIAISNSGSQSQPATYDWLVDTVKPVVQITKHPSNPSNTSSSNFEFMGTDSGSGVNHYQCSIDGANYQACLGPQDYNLNDGQHVFAVVAIDNAGNTSDPALYNWLIDTGKPTVQITKAPDNPTNSRDAVFEFVGQDSGTGINEYQCSIDGAAFQVCTSPDGFSNLVDGSHLFAVRVSDNAGNVSDTANYSWIVDNKGPVIEIVKEPGDTVLIGDDAEVEFTITDENGVDNHECTLNGQAIACEPGETVTIPATEVGDNILIIIAEDEAGNQTSETITWESDYNYVGKVTDFVVNKDRPVDLLFVIDNSISMDNERENLAERIDGLISKVDGLDWQIAVISTDVENEINSQGQFVEMIGMPGTYILDSTMDVSAAQTIFGNTVQNFQGGGENGIGGGNEQGIWATKLTIDRYIAGEAQYTQFFREGADLSVVLLSDEDENSEGNGIQMTPQNFVNYVNTTWNSQKNFTWHSIITKPGDTVCRNDENDYHRYGNIYDELSRLTGFGQTGGAIIGSVCENDYTAQLADIGQSVKDRQNTITLSCLPSDRNGDGRADISVEKNGVVYNGTYQLTGPQMVFDDLLPVGDYKVNYECIE